MKQCPHCHQSYNDPTLEFCLDDGSRLISPNISKTTEETAVLTKFQPHLEIPLKTIPDSKVESSKPAKVQELKEIAVNQGFKMLEISPIIFALIQNYWQWLFADKLNYYSFTEYFLSGSIILWFILLILSLVLSVLALKFGRNKGFAITSLIIIAVNFLLFIVPRR